MSALLFDLAFWVTVPFWALMVFAPSWRWTGRIIGSPLIMLPTLVVYLVLLPALLPQLWSAVSSPELPGFAAFLNDDRAVALVWAQIIAWDLFLGRWVYFEGRRLGIHPLVMGPLLVFTILLSPLAVLVFLAIRAALATKRAGLRSHGDRDLGAHDGGGAAAAVGQADSGAGAAPTASPGP